MYFTCNGASLELEIDRLIVAGWTGRDRAAIDHHIRELADIGVTPPSAVPLYYRVSSSLLASGDAIQVVGDNTSGEVEPLIVRAGGKSYLGLASDHTDRTLEAHSVALSKQACAKPCAEELWELDAITDRLDGIELRSWIEEDGDWVAYQDGTLAAMRPLAELMRGAELDSLAGRGVAMLCGTLGVMSGGVRPARAFRMAMHDPVLDRTIAHRYLIRELPVIA